MANLRVDKITSTEVFETTGSVQFDGDGDRLSVPAGSDFAYGTNDFTIEAFVCLHSLSASYYSIYAQTVSGTNYLWIAVDTDGTLQWWNTASGGGSPLESTSGAIQTDTWHHIAICRSGSTLKGFVDGNEVMSQSNTFDFSNTDRNPSIGNYTHNTTQTWNGHISNLRILKGTALYTKNFTPPTRELTVIPNTVLLACQSKTDATLEKTGKTITVTGNAVANELTPGILTPIVKSGGGSAITGSVEFDGSGDYLSIGSSSDLILGTSDFTIESWINFGPSVSGEHQNIIAAGNPESAGSFAIQVRQDGDSSDSRKLDFRTDTRSVVGGKIGTNDWNHIAVTKQSNQIRLFVNGIQTASNTETENLTTQISAIGYRVASSYGYVKGFISNLRIVKGTALYTDDFIPPTRELKKVPGTVLLCCKDSNDPTAEATGKTITGYGSLDRTDLGVELIPDPYFTNSIDGWSGSGISYDSTNDRLIVDASIDRYFSFDGILKLGSRYQITIDVYSQTPSYGMVRLYTAEGLVTLERGSGIGTKEFTSDRTDLDFRLFNGGDVHIAEINSISVTKLDPGTKPAFTPQVGSDGSVEFAGPTKINSENYFYLPTGNTESRAPVGNYNAGTRGIFGGGRSSGEINVVDYITISSTGNAQDFGDLTVERTDASSFSSTTRGVFAGGYDTPSIRNIIDYITISTTGNAVDFGDTTLAGGFAGAGCSNATRGVFAVNISTNILEYITIASTGNSIDFGDLLGNISEGSACSSPVRGVFFSGQGNGNTISYITIASTGNAQDFGDCLTLTSRGRGGSSNTIKGVFGGGYNQPSTSGNVIEYINVATIGNSIDFGDLSYAARLLGSAANSTRAVFSGGVATINNIEYVTISTNSNSTDFGDLTVGRHAANGCSNGHGGLG